MKRTLITNQTLEPTQVAGFNQFFDDPNVTEAWNYGIGLDQKFSASLYGGAEYFQRDIEMQWFSGQTNLTDRKERTARAYLYWTPHDWVALNAQYLYEKFEQTAAFNLGYKTVETNRVPLGANFYHPSGLSFMAKATYVGQSGEFTEYNNGITFTPGDDQFWLVDAAISYRLPQRYGFISVGAKNLFDTSFQYADTDIANPAIQLVRA